MTKTMKLFGNVELHSSAAFPANRSGFSMMDGYPQTPTDQNIIHTPLAPTNRGYLILDDRHI
jgi:hypothetical protein